MKILALAIIGLATVSAIELHVLKKQGKRISELEAQHRVEIAFEESEEQDNV